MTSPSPQTPRALEIRVKCTGRLIHTPIVWLGHNLRNAVLFSDHSELRTAPVLVSLGDAFLRPSYMQRYFTAHIRQELGICGPLMVDSGGYTLLSHPHLRWSVRQVEKVYAEVPADIFVSLDYPPSPYDDAQTRARRRRRTLGNLARLRDLVPEEKLMPVIHGHTLKEIKLACESVRKLCHTPHQVGIGGIVPLICSGGPIRDFRFKRSDGTEGDGAFWISDALGVVRRSFPDSLVHVFGVGSAVTAISVLALGADSVDSLSWRRSASYGAILLPGCSERFPTFLAARMRSRPVVCGSALSLLDACRCPGCLSTGNMNARLVALSQCYKRRAIHNAWTVLAEVKAFRVAIQADKVGSFLTSRLIPRHRLYGPVMERLKAWQSE
jgi:queuine/archaeosine tRNA-ribosyltransferase